MKGCVKIAEGSVGSQARSEPPRGFGSQPGLDLRLASFGPDLDGIANLALEMETAELARNTAYDSLRKHKAESHTQSASADA